jgi:hypothetical protein
VISGKGDTAGSADFQGCQRTNREGEFVEARVGFEPANGGFADLLKSVSS